LALAEAVCLQALTGLLDLRGEALLVWQGEAVFAGQHFAGKSLKGVAATASFFSEQRISPTGGFSPGCIQCSRA